jgi:hypothetical protein
MKKLVLVAFTSIFALLLSAQKYISPTERLNNEYCSGLFQNAEGTIFDIANNNSVTGYLNILEWLNGRVAGLQIAHQKDGTPIAYIRNSKAGIYLDEMPVDANSINMLSVFDIAMIKIIKGPFAGAFGNGAGGVIAIYTLKGDEPVEGDEAFDS